MLDMKRFIEAVALGAPDFELSMDGSVSIFRRQELDVHLRLEVVPGWSSAVKEGTAGLYHSCRWKAEESASPIFWAATSFLVTMNESLTEYVIAHLESMKSHVYLPAIESGGLDFAIRRLGGSESREEFVLGVRQILKSMYAPKIEVEGLRRRTRRRIIEGIFIDGARRMSPRFKAEEEVERICSQLENAKKAASALL